MIEPIVMRLEDKRTELKGTVQRNRKTIEINIPPDWWYTISTFELTVPKTIAPVYRLPEIKNSVDRIKRLPKTNYWEIRNGDYRSKAEESKLINRRKNKKMSNTIGLIAMLILTTVIMLAVSYSIAQI